MRVLVACEESGVVREAFKKRGHDAWSCDLLPSRIYGKHFRGDVREILDHRWDMMIAFPPCQYLCNSGVRWLHTEAGRWEKMEKAVRFFNLLKDAPIKKIALENPIPHKYGIGKTYDQIIQPWQYGHKVMKSTCIWLEGLPLLAPSNIIGPPPQNTQERKKWQVVHRMPPGPTRTRDRAITFKGIALAMASQWS